MQSACMKEGAVLPKNRSSDIVYSSTYTVQCTTLPTTQHTNIPDVLYIAFILHMLVYLYTVYCNTSCNVFLTKAAFWAFLGRKYAHPSVKRYLFGHLLPCYCICSGRSFWQILLVSSSVVLYFLYPSLIQQSTQLNECTEKNFGCFQPPAALLNDETHSQCSMSDFMGHSDGTDLYGTQRCALFVLLCLPVHCVRSVVFCFSVSVVLCCVVLCYGVSCFSVVVCCAVPCCVALFCVLLFCVVLCCVVLCCVVLCCVVLCCVLSCCVFFLLCCVVLCCVVLCCVVLCCVVLCCVVLCCVVVCCGVLWCVVVCCFVLCCVVSLYCVVLCCAVLCCIVLCDVVLYCMVWYCVAWCRVVSYHVVLCCVVLCCVVLCCVVLCCVVLCCVVLCCVVLCCVVLCCVVLCCDVLCCAVFPYVVCVM